MTINRLSKKQDVNKNERIHVEKLTEEFIDSGGKTTFETKPDRYGNNDEIRFTLRVPKKIIKDIDERRKDQPGSISRNTWILQSISDKLMLK